VTEDEPLKPKRGRPPKDQNDPVRRVPVKKMDPVVDELVSLRAFILNKAEDQEKMIKAEGHSSVTWCREFMASQFLELARWVEYRIREVEGRDQVSSPDPGRDQADGTGGRQAGQAQD
jgi:hypothetical protein